MKSRRGGKDETPGFWCDLIAAARQDYESEHGAVHRAVAEAYEGRAGYARREYGGVRLTSNGTPTMTKVRPPRMYALTHGMESMLFHRRPKFFVRSYVGRLETMAQDFERLLNVMWSRYVGDKELRWIIRDAIKYGRGWGMLGFDFDEDEERKRGVQRRRLARTLGESVIAQATSPEAVAEPLVPSEEPNEAEPETWAGDARARVRKPSFCRVPHGDVTVDPSARTEYDARWIDVRSFVDMESLKADPFFKHFEQVKPVGGMRNGKWQSVTGGPKVLESPSSRPGDEYASLPGQMSGKAYEFAEVHYTAVKRPGGDWDVLIYAKGQERFGRKLTAPYWFGCPLMSLAWNDDGDRMGVISDGERLLGGIVEEASLRTRLKDHWNRKPSDVVAVDENVFNNSSNRAAIEVQRTATFLPVRNPNEAGAGTVPLANFFFPIPRNANIAEVYQHLQLISKDFEAVTGLGPNQQLQALKSETSSFEAQEIARNARSRGVEKQEAVEDFCAKLGHRLLMLAAQFFDGERAAEYVSQDAAKRWTTYEFNPGDVQDGLGVSVERGSMKPQSSESRKQWLGQLLGLAMQNPAFAAKVNIEELFARLNEEEGILDGSKLLNGNVNLQEMVLAMMQMQLAGAGAKAAPGGQSVPAQGGTTEV